MLELKRGASRFAQVLQPMDGAPSSGRSKKLPGNNFSTLLLSSLSIVQIKFVKLLLAKVPPIFISREPQKNADGSTGFQKAR
jgi:hypothetical protein